MRPLKKKYVLFSINVCSMLSLSYDLPVSLPFTNPLLWLYGTVKCLINAQYWVGHTFAHCFMNAVNSGMLYSKEVCDFGWSHLQAFARFSQQVIMCVDRLQFFLVIWNRHVTKWQALLLFSGAFPSTFFSFFFIPSHELLEVCPLSVRAPAGQCNKQINTAGLCTLISVAVPPTRSLRPTRQPRKWPLPREPSN